MSHRDIVGDGTPIEREWTVKGFMEKGALAILAAEPKAGKTALATNLAYCVASGNPFLGLPTLPSPVLWLSYEESESERRYLVSGYEEAEVYTNMSPLPIDTPQGIEQLREGVDRLQPGLIVIDPLMGAVQADSTSEARNGRKIMEGLNQLRRDCGVSILVLHHVRKANGRKGDQNKMTDSHQIAAAASQTWIMEVSKKGNRKIELHGSGRGREANRIWLVDSTDEWSYRMVDASGSEDKSVMDKILAVLAEAPEGLTIRAIADRIAEPLGTVQNRNTDLKKLNKVRVASKQGRSPIYVRCP